MKSSYLKFVKKKSLTDKICLIVAPFTQRFCPILPIKNAQSLMDSYLSSEGVFPCFGHLRICAPYGWFCEKRFAPMMGDFSHLSRVSFWKFDLQWGSKMDIFPENNPILFIMGGFSTNFAYMMGAFSWFTYDSFLIAGHTYLEIPRVSTSPSPAPQTRQDLAWVCLTLLMLYPCLQAI